MHISKAVTFPTMKKLTLALLLTLNCSTAWAADVQKGWAAQRAGDYASALAEWKLLAEQGDPSAQYGMGFLYANGQGVISDNKLAAKWFRLAAEQGLAAAQHDLGEMYFQDRGDTGDYSDGVKWLRLAAESGHSWSQNYLGLIYKEGKGVIEDSVYAHMWFNIAASNGVNSAKLNKDTLVKRMTPQDISKAQDLARECVKKNYKDC